MKLEKIARMVRSIISGAPRLIALKLGWWVSGAYGIRLVAQGAGRLARLADTAAAVSILERGDDLILTRSLTALKSTDHLHDGRPVHDFAESDLPFFGQSH
jgi:hypothetical protein